MTTNTDSAFRVLAPALLGLVAVAALDWLAAGALAPVALVALAVGLTAAYAGVVAALIVAAVRRAGRFHDVMLLQALRQAEASKKLAIYDQQTGLFHRWYFEFRLSGEVKRCQRYGSEMAVLAIRVEPSDGNIPSATWEVVSSDLALLVARTMRTVDIPATLGALEYALCLPECDRAGAEEAAQRVLDALGDYDAAVGLALYPEDGSDGETLLEQARQRADRRSSAAA